MISWYARPADFNPRSHKGSDESEFEKSVDLEISIHAPTRGATGVFKKVGTSFKISIHAPTRGATALLLKFNEVIFNFNPRSHKGSDVRSSW